MDFQVRGGKPTSSDVARLAGVSKSAVSRCFTEGGSVSAKTRVRVLDAANALGYRPNPIARSLATRRSALIGVAMSHMDQFYAPLLTCLSERLSQEGFRLLLFKASPSDIADEELAKIVQYNVDALILASVKLSNEFALSCLESGVPVLQINPTLDAKPLSTISGENESGAFRLGEFLIAGGHRSFAYMAGVHGSYTSETRHRGYLAALSAAGRPEPIYDIGHYSFEGGLLAARRLLSGPVLPDAIFCANDSMACATIDVARREFGIAVGSALSVVGFDDEPIARWPGFDVTTFSMPLDKIVDRVIELLGRMWADPEDFDDIKVPGALVVRGSARRPSAF